MIKHTQGGSERLFGETFRDKHTLVEAPVPLKKRFIICLQTFYVIYLVVMETVAATSHKINNVETSTWHETTLPCRTERCSERSTFRKHGTIIKFLPNSIK